MHDLPSQTRQQQAHARPVSGEHLEVLGKTAALRYHHGESSTLNEAVVEVVKRAGLSPEQVRRVIEFTNQNAYAREFSKESAAHKYVEFQGGPADPAEILKDLNDGGGGTVFDQGRYDYNNPPPTVEKHASALRKNLQAVGMEKAAAAVADPEMNLLEQAFSVDGAYNHVDPLKDSYDMKSKLAGARDRVMSDINSIEIDVMMIGEELYGHVKQAALQGVPLGHIVQAWSAVTEEPGQVKAAFDLLSERLIKDRVFSSGNAMASSIEKTAGVRRLVNPEHPLITTYQSFCEERSKLAQLQQARDELIRHHDAIELFIRGALQKTAGGAPLASRLGGMVGRGVKAVTDVADAASKPVDAFVTAVGGDTAGRIAGGAVKYAPHAAAALGAKELYDRNIKYGPGQIPLRYAKSHIPGTREYYIREMQLQQSPGLM